MKQLFKNIFVLLCITGCSKDPEVTNEMLDGEILFDPSLYNPQDFLISYAIPNPTPEQALMPVIIASHGYTATTFEWNEFVEFANSGGEVLVSKYCLAAMGGLIMILKIQTGKIGRQPSRKNITDWCRRGIKIFIYWGLLPVGPCF